MIHHKLDILDNEQNIIRPLIINVVNHVKAITGIPGQTPIIYPGRGDQVAHTLDVTTGRYLAVTESTDAVKLEATFKYDPANWSGQATHRNNHEPIFKDDTIPLIAKPIYQDMEATIDIAFNARSQNEAFRWRNEMSNRVSQMGDTALHSSNYVYLVPKWLWGIAKELHTLREANGGYNQSFNDFINASVCAGMRPLSDQVGQSRDIGVVENQDQIQGMFDFTIEPNAIDKNNESGEWMAKFTYTIWISVPTAISVSHPLVVHNSIVPAKFIPQSLLSDGLVAQRASNDRNMLRFFEADNALRQHIPRFDVYRSPAFDKWTPDQMYRGYQMYGTFLVGVKDSDDYLLNLQDLGNYRLGSVMIEWCKKHHGQLTSPYRHPFVFNVYENESMVTPEDIYVDENLIVRIKRPLSVRKRYRVVISCLKRLIDLDPAGIRDMAELKDFACAFISLINASTGDINHFSAYADVDFLKVCAIDAPPSKTEVFVSSVSPMTVMTGIIETHRYEDLNKKG